MDAKKFYLFFFFQERKIVLNNAFCNFSSGLLNTCCQMCILGFECCEGKCVNSRALVSKAGEAGFNSDS